MAGLDRRWRWAILIAWLLLCAYFLQHYAAGIHYFTLSDTDDNMRYLQVRDWLNGQSWWDLRQYRLDPPVGFNIHWSRLVDLPIAALMLFFRLFMSSVQADHLAVAIAPMLPMLPLMAALAFITRRLSRDGLGWFIAMLLPLGAGMGLSMFMPMRIDHHGWQLALTAVTLAGLVDRKWVRGGVIAGIASAASVAIGMEMIAYLAGAGALITLRWIFKEGAARRLRPYALCLAGTTAIGYAGFASIDNRQLVCDALSPIWTSVLLLSAGLLFLLSLLPLRNWRQRLIAAALAGLVVGSYFVLRWPQCLSAYQMSPELRHDWLAYIREAKPIYVQSRDVWVSMIAMPAIGLLSAMAGCWAARRDPERLWAWATVTLMIAFAISLLFWEIRAGPAAQLLAIPPIAWAIWGLLTTLLRGRWPARIAALIALIVAGCAIAIYPLYPVAARTLENLSKDLQTHGNSANGATANLVSGRNNASATQPGTKASKSNESAKTKTPELTYKQKIDRANGRCRSLPALQPLDQISPAIILTMVDLGPRLIAVTHHSAVAGPYHRNGQAILDVQSAMDGPPERFLQIAAEHHASYMLFCPYFPEGTIYQQRSPQGVYAQLMRGTTFPFLKPVPLKFNGKLPYTLYRIVPGDSKLAAASAAPSGKKTP